MKKMRGIIDPISLGFILSALLAGAGLAGVNHHKTKTTTKATVHSAQSTQNNNLDQKEEFAALFSK